ncbi:hypothetical protein GRI58_11020 [Porphyrobacter algicida]|uniref:GlsB/YeaQ/YmgE family stress response membrane protein n=1 Tax=Qipengyuania algicida TaxID=1836209 RepID=A0A845AJM0_9SPHN|nr:hypothetical protein [Qipengyuania algicida]MXP29353.1 hypothetical protein [Qipengyuania algicida]
MGLALVIIIGAILGWLGAFLLGRDDVFGGTINVFAGIAGALFAATRAGPDLLPYGASAIELIWGCLGAALAIIIVNLASDLITSSAEHRS